MLFWLCSVVALRTPPGLSSKVQPVVSVEGLSRSLASALVGDARLRDSLDTSFNTSWFTRLENLLHPLHNVAALRLDEFCIESHDVSAISRQGIGGFHFRLFPNVSQSVGRLPASSSGICPTLTPGSVVFVEDVGRRIMSVEKLLVHGFPIHRMNIPASTSDEVLNDLGGNTMHLKAVGLATLVGLGLVDWSLPAAQAGRRPSGRCAGKAPQAFDVVICCSL